MKRGSSDSSEQAARAYDRTAHASRSSETAVLRAWNNAAKNYLLQYAVRRVLRADDATLRVVELACGRGGELLKWMQLAQTLDTTVDWRGADVSASSLEVLRERFASQRNARMVGEDGDRRFQIADAGEPLTDAARAALAPDGPVHVVSMQMAFHYMWRSPQTLDNWCANAGSLLAPGGVAVVTYFDAQAALNATTAATQSTTTSLTLELGRGAARVQFESDDDRRRARSESGVPYRFFMDGSVDGAVEYTVRARELVRVARRHGLELLRATRLVDLPARHAKVDLAAAHAVLRGALHGAGAIAHAHAQPENIHASCADDVAAVADLARFYRGLVLVKTRA